MKKLTLNKTVISSLSKEQSRGAIGGGGGGETQAPEVCTIDFTWVNCTFYCTDACSTPCGNTHDMTCNCESDFCATVPCTSPTSPDAGCNPMTHDQNCGPTITCPHDTCAG